MSYNKLNSNDVWDPCARAWKGTYLAIVLEPLGSNLGDGVVLVLGAGLHTGQADGASLAHGVEEFVVHVLLQICCFL